jgi:hypothetical protein
MSRSSGDILELDQVMLPVSQSDFDRVLEAVTDAEQEHSEEFRRDVDGTSSLNYYPQTFRVGRRIRPESAGPRTADTSAKK